MKLVIVIVLLVVGSVIFHWLSPWWFTPIASNWSSIDLTVNITIWVTGVVFVVVNLFVAYAIYRFRYRQDKKSEYNPENKKLELWLTGITSVGIIAMLAPGLIVWADFIKPPKNSIVVEAVGQQWQWSFRFPGEDGILGKSNPAAFSLDNPFGLDKDDPNGQDDRLIYSNELHLPLNQPILLQLRSKDVLHNFAVPQFRVKMDLVPGSVSSLWLTPTREGRFDILCQELCGIAHFAMRGQVVVEKEEAYHAWLASFPTFAELNQPPDVDISKGKDLYAVCSACHGMNAEGNPQLNAPKLSGFASDYIQRQLASYQKGIRGTNEKNVFGLQMAPMVSALQSDEDLISISRYISALPEQASPPTISGNSEKGQVYYANCGICHGEQGQGNEYNGAPKLAGQHDWYLKRQIEHFKSGIRGSHKSDQYGMQMRLMAAVLKTDEAVNDLLAYINTLPLSTPENLALVTHPPEGGVQ